MQTQKVKFKFVQINMKQVSFTIIFIMQTLTVQDIVDEKDG